MRRTALLLCAPVLAAGLLAGCDLPGGSPRILGPDQMPNNTADEAPTVSVPAFINGTLDQNDTADFFALAPPSATKGVQVTCTGAVEVGAGIRGGIEEHATDDIVVCDGQPHVLDTFTPNVGRQPVLFVGPLDSTAGLTSYFLTVSYVQPVN
jgi:hypothetical protein